MENKIRLKCHSCSCVFLLDNEPPACIECGGVYLKRQKKNKIDDSVFDFKSLEVDS
jgi:hypothetical protein